MNIDDYRGTFDLTRGTFKEDQGQAQKVTKEKMEQKVPNKAEPEKLRR